MATAPLLFLIIFLEGYVVLSTELLAIRLLMPFTGSGTDTVSIIIAAVLMPLAFGYYAGGRFRNNSKTGKSRSVRRKLVINLTIAAIILTPGLSYVFLDKAFDMLHHQAGWDNRLLITTLYSALFLVYPVFLLGQTVPLISHYFSRRHLPEMAGRILFFSTMGSFTGAIFGTLVLMAFLGVHHTVSITVAAMVLLAFILSKDKISLPTVLISLCLLATLALNSSYAMEKMNIVRNNKYNTIQIEDRPETNTRVIKLNRTGASGIYLDNTEPRFFYGKYIEDNFIEPIRNAGPEKKILILGAGGFTLGRTDTKNKYVYVDIDKDLKDVAENLFLEEKLGPNKSFVPIEARAYFNQTDEKFDVIVLDLFRDPVSVPEYLITREFMQQVKDHLNEGGLVAGNFIASPAFLDPFSIRLDNTIRAVFPNINRVPLKVYDVWREESRWNNIIYSYVHHSDATDGIYTDDKNRSVYDRPAKLQR